MTPRKPTPKRRPHECAACGTKIRGKAQYSIHRDGFCIGPEVSLCVACGEDVTPTCEQLWEMIRERRRASAGRKRVFCHDCKGEVSNEPILCEDCVSRRNEEGMSREDRRTIQTWRRT
jgi:hypothetical protein